jgi:hypothetical protein
MFALRSLADSGAPALGFTRGAIFTVAGSWAHSGSKRKNAGNAKNAAMNVRPSVIFRICHPICPQYTNAIPGHFLSNY